VRSETLTLCAELEDASVQSGPCSSMLPGWTVEDPSISKDPKADVLQDAGCFSDGLSSTLRSVSDLQAFATSMSVAIVVQA
jgi:hypothetical protein